MNLLDKMLLKKYTDEYGIFTNEFIPKLEKEFSNKECTILIMMFPKDNIVGIKNELHEHGFEYVSHYGSSLLAISNEKCKMPLLDMAMGLFYKTKDIKFHESISFAIDYCKFNIELRKEMEMSYGKTNRGDVNHK